MLNPEPVGPSEKNSTNIRFPRDIVFIDRSFAGHIGNLSRLKATGPWRAMIQRHSRTALSHRPHKRGQVSEYVG